MNRLIVLDTETTGLQSSEHRIVEIGCLEIIDRRETGKTLQYYLNPDRHIDKEATRIHGIDDNKVSDAPRFAEIVNELIDFIKDSTLLIHNAEFDVNFLNAELKRLEGDWKKIEHYCKIIDSLSMARKKHPGQKNNLDALCRRYGIDNSERTFHGALLDAQLLAQIYLAMTGGQTSFLLEPQQLSTSGNRIQDQNIPTLPVAICQRHRNAGTSAFVSTHGLQ